VASQTSPSIAIQIGGIGALAPERRSDLAALGLRAMIGGLLSCYMTAAVVGLLTEGTISAAVLP
jgi:CNT family concentrative nucleoside transporter